MLVCTQDEEQAGDLARGRELNYENYVLMQKMILYILNYSW